MMSLILLSVGGLMALLGVAGVFARGPNPGAEPNGSGLFRSVLVVIGVVGAGLIALGVRVRSGPVAGAATRLWVGYGLFWLLLAPLLVFVGGDVVRTGSEPGQGGRAVSGLLMGLVILGGPAIGWVHRRMRPRPAARPATPPPDAPTR